MPGLSGPELCARLRQQGLITITRARHNKFVAITPTFPFEYGKAFRTISAQKRAHHH